MRRIRDASLQGTGTRGMVCGVYRADRPARRADIQTFIGVSVRRHTAVDGTPSPAPQERGTNPGCGGPGNSPFPARWCVQARADAVVLSLVIKEI